VKKFLAENLTCWIRASQKQVGVASNCDRPKELSSFQSFSSNHARSTIEKVGFSVDISLGLLVWYPEPCS
jgi:hypothetical protein